ncbi:MAG: hypothetical protein QXT40_02770 [Candidatus Micrarchaeia archaeon]
MKAQVSVEFFLLFIIVISIFSIFMLISIEMQRQVDYISKYDEALSVASRIGNAVNSVISNQIEANVDIPYGYRIDAISGAIIATNLLTNVSASWPISRIQINSTVQDNSTLINIKFINSTIYLS